MKIVDIGINHKTAPVEIREQIAIDTERASRIFAFFKKTELIRELFLLSTCNRVEVIFTTDSFDLSKNAIVSLMCKTGKIPESDFLPLTYTLQNMDAVRHIFRVASGLDSMVVGEPQILGQIKQAYLTSVQHRATGVILNRLLHRTFHVAKRVRSETGISESAVSISYAAVQLAKKIFHTLEDKKILLIGAGEMAELTARHLMANGVKSLSVANRTFDRAIDIARQFGGEAVSMEEIGYQLESGVDIVISSTASPDYVITKDKVRSCIRRRRNRPLFLIDIAVPRDIDPGVNDISNVYVYDIDDLKGVVRFNMAHRQQEAVKAERIVSEEIIRFEKWLKTLDIIPTIVSLKQKAENIIQTELKRSRHALHDLTPEQRASVETLVHSVSEKILNDPFLFLKRQAGRPGITNCIDFTKKLFNLDNEDNGET